MSKLTKKQIEFWKGYLLLLGRYRTLNKESFESYLEETLQHLLNKGVIDEAGNLIEDSKTHYDY